MLSGTNSFPVGTVNLSTNAPVEGQSITAVRAFNDIDGIPGPVTFSWQAQTNPAAGANGWTNTGTGATLVPSNAHVGLQLRAVATYTDGAGAPTQVFSAATGTVTNVNDLATGAPTISDTSPSVGQQLTAAPGTIADTDGIAGVTFRYQWQAGDGTTWANIGTGRTLTPIALHAGSQLRVIASFTDNHGTAESRISAATAAVPGIAPAVPTPVLTPVLTTVTAAITGGGLAFAPPAPAVAPKTLALTTFKVALAAKPARVVVTFRLSLAATVRLEIRTPKGVLVRRISRKAGAGAVSMRWDRRNAKGRLVPLGNYRVTVAAATADGLKKSASKVVRVRKPNPAVIRRIRRDTTTTPLGHMPRGVVFFGVNGHVRDAGRI